MLFCYDEKSARKGMKGCVKWNVSNLGQSFMSYCKILHAMLWYSKHPCMTEDLSTMAKLYGICTFCIFELIKTLSGHNEVFKKSCLNASSFTLIYSNHTMRKTVSSNSPRHKSRQLEDFGAKWYDRRKRCPSNEPRSLWSLLVKPHPLTLYMSLHIEDKTWWKHWTKRLKDHILLQSITTAIIH